MFISIVLLLSTMSGVEAMGVRYLRVEWHTLYVPIETNATCPGMDHVIGIVYGGNLTLKPIAGIGRTIGRFARLVKTGKEYTIAESNFTTRLCVKTEMCMVVTVNDCQDSASFICITTTQEKGKDYNTTAENLAGSLYVDSNPGPVYAKALPRAVSDVLNISWYITCISQIGTRFGGDKKRWHWEYQDKDSHTWTEYSIQSDIIVHEDEEDPDVPCNRLQNSTLRRRLTDEDEGRIYRCYNSRDQNGQWVKYEQYLADFSIDEKVTPDPGPTLSPPSFATKSRCTYLNSSLSTYMSNYTFRCASISDKMYQRLINLSPPCDDPATGTYYMCEFQVWLCNDEKDERNCSMTCNDFCLTRDLERCSSYKSACTNGCDPGRYGLKCEHACSEGCSGTCDWVTGICIGITECRTGWYTNKCNIKCPKNCLDVCDQESGNCTECKPGWYTSQCQQKCPKNCLSKCDMEYSYCNACRTGFYGQLCTSACPEHCLADCDMVDGNCTACVPGRYGHTCMQECPTCFRSCNQKTGACIDEDTGSNLLIIGASGGVGFLVVMFVVCIFCYKKKMKAKQFPDKVVVPKLTAADRLKVRKDIDGKMSLNQIRASQVSLTSTRKQRSPYVISPSSIEPQVGDLFKTNPDASTSKSQRLEESSVDHPDLSPSRSHSYSNERSKSIYSFEGSKSGHSLEGSKSGHNLEGTKSAHSIKST